MLRRGLPAEYSYPIKDSSFMFENVYFLSCLFFKSGGGGRGGRIAHAGGLTKKLYTIYPPKKNFLSIITLLNARGLVTGTAVSPDEKCCGYPYMQPLAGSQRVQWRHWCSRRSTLPF